jgi:6-pyruvoyl-tetrahydropterin synthase
MGLVVDFRQLRASADEAVAALDQRVIEDVPDFAQRPSTPAAVAEWLFEKLKSAVPSPRCWLEAVEVEADPGIRFEYSGE